MGKIDYFVTAQGIIERGTFYNYIHDMGYEDHIYTREYMINSEYPFGICMKKKKVMVVESATQCYLMQKAGKVKTVEEFKDIINSNKSLVKKRKWL